MIKGIDSKAETGPSTALAEIDRLQDNFDDIVGELQKATELAIADARRTLLAVYAFNGRIFVENPHGLDAATAEPSQSPVESD